MQLTGHITPESLMSLEAYTKWRKIHKPEVLAHRKLLKALSTGTPEEAAAAMMEHVLFNVTWAD